MKKSRSKLASAGDKEPVQPLGMAQTQLYDVWQRHRHKLYRSLRTCEQRKRAEVMEAVTRVVTFTGEPRL